MSETVYIETSILGYLTARSTRNLILAANIEITREWWEFRRSAFTLYISQVVLDEVARGDTEIATKRLEILNGMPLVELNQAVQIKSSLFRRIALILVIIRIIFYSFVLRKLKCLIIQILIDIDATLF
ncbi:hypothetical protein [Nostoc sp. WHI]|uniref:hypothetical protein n=1 Tax=Nostoc sp. WHI TaxID=2650611 RepID=UPI001E3FB153|nr:hypothetical protein [Nostoc sp. WHI]